MLEGWWPKGRLSSELFVEVASFLAEMDFRFIQSTDLASHPEMKGLWQFTEKPEFAEWQKVARGSQSTSKVELPWLDVEKAIVFGGGADLGDDTHLVLDYRSDLHDPRVVSNEYLHDEADAVTLKGGKAPGLVWREVAPSFSAFCRLVRPDGKNWLSAAPEPISQAIVDELRHLPRSAWPDLTILYDTPKGTIVTEVEGPVILEAGDLKIRLRKDAPIVPPCVIKIPRGSRLATGYFQQGSPVRREEWYEVRPGRFRRGFRVDPSKVV